MYSALNLFIVFVLVFCKRFATYPRQRNYSIRGRKVDPIRTVIISFGIRKEILSFGIWVVLIFFEIRVVIKSFEIRVVIISFGIRVVIISFKIRVVRLGHLFILAFWVR